MTFRYKLNEAEVYISGQFINEDYFEIDDVTYADKNILPVLSDDDIKGIEREARKEAKERLDEAKIRMMEDEDV